MNKTLMKTQKWISNFLHICVLVLSVFLVISISIDSFRGQGIEYYDQPRFLKTQVIICVVFLLDFFVELFMSERKWRYLLTHILFFFVSIPYLWIIHRMGFEFFSPKAAYMLQYIPLVRGGYALAMVVGWITSNRAADLFATYLITLMASVYFASLVFFMFEQGVNPGVTAYSDALWWAAMDVTTVGSNISPVSVEGRILAVVLAALGMMMFPIFTVYITSLITHKHNAGQTDPNAAAPDSGSQS
ncbi:MAG: potassium channel family protein [Muribaculaceae bacterium]|nr:potassium channel family protein [Muribaculaceae bacterium]